MEQAGDGDGDENGWFFGRWMKSASKALGNGAEEGEEGEDGLGPAFAESGDAELRMVRNILRLGELRVEDVMTPRADIVAVAEDADLDTVMG
ncbi:MAG: hypothetical protein AAGE90_01765, partial [Pseudomonadota bacterium]